jgi:membrane-bound lytic murein transglycosylase F
MMRDVRPIPGAACGFIAVLVAAAILSACDLSTGPLAQARKTGELVVVTRYGSATYYEGRDGPDGFEYALTQAFARHLGLKVRYVVEDSIVDVLRAVAAGRGSLGAAGLTRTADRERRLRFGPDYEAVRQLVVCRRGGPLPASAAELVGIDLLVLADSSYEERLRELEANTPGLVWRRSEELSTDEILERVWRADADCTVADSNLVDINRRYYPELVVAFPISEVQHLAWVLPGGADDLAAALREWFDQASRSGLLARLRERYYGHTLLFDYVDLRAFMRRLNTRLPKYRKSFEAAAEQYSLPWTVLAAVSYQESHWDPKARSPTGVRGLMMLTQRTARAMGVRDRTDPLQSIRGGARYLSQMRQRLPEEVLPPDRLWLALAAYNLGFGHLEDARALARRKGLDPNLWHDLKTVLPLLSRRQYYRKLKHGVARGAESVRYVERVRNYLDILDRALDARPGV